MFAKTLDSADSLDISTVLELASQGFVHTVASGAGASMACIAGIGKWSLSVESYVDKKGVEMVRLGAVAGRWADGCAQVSVRVRP